MNRGQKIFAVLSFVSLAVSGCSLRDRDVKYGVSLQLSQSSQNQLLNAPVFSSATIAGGGAGASPPAAVSGFQCFALNIMGPGLQPDSRFGCSDPKQMGMLAGMASVSGGRVEAVVPAGPARVVQLLGFQSTIGCPSVDKLAALRDPVTGSIPGVGQAYVLGSTTVDIFDDTVVKITPAVSNWPIAFKGCGGSGPQMQLGFFMANQSNAIQGQFCARFDIQANVDSSYNGALPAVMPTFVDSDSHTAVPFYSDPNCTTSVASGTVFSNWNGNPWIPLYVNVPAGVNSFQAKVDTTATGWTIPVQTFKVVSNRLGLTFYDNHPMSVADNVSQTCDYVDLAVYNQASSPIAPLPSGQYLLTIYNNTSRGATPTSMKLYSSAAACQNQSSPAIAPDAAQDSSVHYTLNVSGATTLWFRNPANEQVSLGISRVDNSIQPYVSGLAFTPWSLSSNAMQVEVGHIGGGLVHINFVSAGTAVSGVQINGLPCNITMKTATVVECMAPGAMAIGDIYPIQLVDAAGDLFPTGMNVKYNLFDAGSGVAASPYILSNADQLLSLGTAYQFSSFQLANDIDASTIHTGGMTVASGGFNGDFDGNFHQIINLDGSLFMMCTSSMIHNLTLQVNIAGSGTYLGAVCQNLSSGTLTNVHVVGTITNSNPSGNTGALAGLMSGATIQYSSFGVGATPSSITVHPSATAGGLIGWSQSGGTVQDSWVINAGINASAGTSGGYLGGLIGNLTSTTVQRSFTRVSMSGNVAQVGGLAGYVSGGNILRSAADSTISGSSQYVGGFIGQLNSGTVNHSMSFSSTISGSNYVGGFVGSASAGATISNSYSIVTTTLSGTNAKLFVGVDPSGATYSNAKYVQLAGTANSAITGLNAVSSSTVDSLSAYGTGFTGSGYWHQRNSAPNGTVAKSPVPDWACVTLNGASVNATNPAAVAAGFNCF